MFNNLKSKVSKDSSKLDLSEQSSNKDNNLKRVPSTESLNSNATSEHKKKKDETIKKWENKVQTLVLKVREQNSKIEDLEAKLSKDKLEYERKINEVKESSALNVKQMLDDHRAQIQKLEQDKEKLQKRVIKAEYQAESLRNHSFNDDEEADNLKDLFKQEIAKIKHMLILKEKENESLQDQMEENRSTVTNLEQSNKKLNEEISKRSGELMKLIKERELESEERRSQQTTIRGLLNDKELLEQKLEEYKLTLEKKETILSRIERSSADLHTKLQQTTYDYDQLKMKYNRLEEEKSDRESDMKDRIRSLESHLAMVRETEEVDQRVKLLEEKCFQLDSKNREEKELKDKLLKSWSERVNSLENQIANLNKKIAEDAEEISNYNQSKAEIKDGYENQLKSMKLELTDKDKKIESYQQELDKISERGSKEKQIQQNIHSKLQEEYEEKCTENNKLSRDIFELKKEFVKLQEQLNTANSELKMKSSSSMKLDEDVKRLSTELEEKCEELSSLNNERFKRELKVTELNSQVSSLESIKNELEKRISQIDSDFKSVQSQLKLSNDERDSVKKKLESVLEQDGELRIECDHRIKTMKSEVESKVRELEVAHVEIKQLKEQIHEMEMEKDTVLIGIESTEVLKLKNQLEILNTQLSDKNNMIRTQKQKISDLKKTLCKEIKLNNNLSNSNIPGIHNSQESELNNSRNSSFNQLSSATNISFDQISQSDSNSNLIGRLTTNHVATDNASSSGDEGPVVVDQNGFVIMDQINFRYLKHVILKFLLSKESEAYQMIKAVSTLLRLTTDEEARVKHVLLTRSSWFPSISKSSGSSTSSHSSSPHHPSNSNSSNISSSTKKKTVHYQLSPKSSSIALLSASNNNNNKNSLSKGNNSKFS